MLVIKVFPLPLNLTENDLREIHLLTVEVAKSVPALKIKNENDMTVAFPRDLMAYGLGSDIAIEIVILPRADDRLLDKSERDTLTYNLVSAVKAFFPKARVHSYILQWLQGDGQCILGPEEKGRFARRFFEGYQPTRGW